MRSTAELAGSESRASTGRQASFVEIYERDYARMVHLARLTLGDEAPHDDVVQQAFVQLYRNWDRVDTPTSYVLGEVVSGCRPSARPVAGRRARCPSSTAPTKDGRRRDGWRGVFGSLDPHARAIVVLRYVEGLSDSDIARVLGRRPATVRSLLAQSLVRLAGSSITETERRLQQELQAEADRETVRRPSLGELLIDEGWKRPGLRTSLARAADRVRHVNRIRRLGPSRLRCIPGRP